jgi:hypothetical protein
MDIGNVGFIGVVVIVAVGALKEKYPAISGNTTRLVALIIGAVIGLISQFGLLPGVSATIVSGVFAGVAAVATVTVADRVGTKV